MLNYRFKLTFSKNTLCFSYGASIQHLFSHPVLSVQF